MADLSLDELLSSSLKSVAEPAPSTGVADLIRSRVAAGETGTSVAGNGATAPGWGGGSAGVVTIVAPLALILVTGAVGGALGVTGVFGAPLGEAGGPRPYSLVVDGAAQGLECPGGSPVTDLYPGERLLATARTDDSSWLAVRDPAQLDSTVWVAAASLKMDAGVASLPVSGCGELVVQTPTPTATPTQAPPPPPDNGGSTPPKPPPPPKDTTAPVMTSIKASKAIVLNNEVSTISVSATDNKKVTKIVLKWSNGAVSGQTTITGASGSYNWSSNSVAANSYGNYTFTAVAYDAAGNHSAPVQVVVNRQYFG